MTGIDREVLRKAAEAATPGPWVHDSNINNGIRVIWDIFRYEIPLRIRERFDA